MNICWLFVHFKVPLRPPSGKQVQYSTNAATATCYIDNGSIQLILGFSKVFIDRSMIHCQMMNFRRRISSIAPPYCYLRIFPLLNCTRTLPRAYYWPFSPAIKKGILPPATTEVIRSLHAVRSILIIMYKFFHSTLWSTLEVCTTTPPRGDQTDVGDDTKQSCRMKDPLLYRYVLLTTY